MAWAFSGKDQKEFAGAVEGIEYHRLRAILAQSNTKPVTVDELWAIADAAGVPRWFMTEGFDGDRIAAIEGRLNRLERKVSQPPAPSPALIEQVTESLRNQGWTRAPVAKGQGNGQKRSRPA